MIGRNYGVAQCACCNGNSVSYAHMERLIRHIAVRWCMIGLLWVSRGHAMCLVSFAGLNDGFSDIAMPPLDDTIGLRIIG
jgi:hypothetical protein